MDPDQAISNIFSSLYEDKHVDLWSVGGSYGVIHYTEPFETADVDVFIVLKKGLPLKDVYSLIEGMGYGTVVFEEKTYFKVKGVYLQVVPVCDELETEAVDKSVRIGPLVVMIPEYLIALKLNAYRPKDKIHIGKLKDQASVDYSTLFPILRKYNLMDRWNRLEE